MIIKCSNCHRKINRSVDTYVIQVRKHDIYRSCGCVERVLRKERRESTGRYGSMLLTGITIGLLIAIVLHEAI